MLNILSLLIAVSQRCTSCLNPPLIECGMSNPLSDFAHNAYSYLKHLPITKLCFHSEILCIKRCDIHIFNCNNINTDNIVVGTCYTLPS